MPLTRQFKSTVQARAKRDSKFRKALLQEAIECFLSGDVDAGKIVLRDFINATSGFVRVGRAVRRSPKSLMRMFSPRGNPTAKNLFEILVFLQDEERVQFRLRSRPKAA
jgi:DNA-binding phage protein